MNHLKTDRQSLPGSNVLALQGSVHETATGLHGQNALFRPLVNCNHQLECIVAKHTVREHRKRTATH